MKIKLTKGDVKFLFNNYSYFEEFMRLMRNLRILLAEDQIRTALDWYQKTKF